MEEMNDLSKPNNPVNNLENKQETTMQDPAMEPVKPFDIRNFREFKWYEWLAALPAVVLLFGGGAVGALLGVGGWYLSVSWARKSDSNVLKAVVIIGIALIYYISFTVIAFMINNWVSALD